MTHWDTLTVDTVGCPQVPRHRRQVVFLALRMRARQASMRMGTRPGVEGEDDSPAAREGAMEMLERGNVPRGGLPAGSVGIGIHMPSR